MGTQSRRITIELSDGIRNSPFANSRLKVLPEHFVTVEMIRREMPSITLVNGIRYFITQATYDELKNQGY